MSTRDSTAILDDNGLPEGWEWSTLGDVSEKPQYGWTTKANHDTGKLKLLRTTDITSGSVDWSSVPFCTEEPEDVEKYLIESGDVLISRAGSVGVSFLINKPERAVFASYLIRFRPKKGIDTKYFYYYLKSPSYWEAIGASKSGIAVPNVNASKLAQVPIPVAPLDQQKLIVAEIEKQFSRLDEAVANLKRVKANLKRYKAAVLKAAVEGRLVETEAELARRESRSYETGEQLLQRILETRRSQWKGKGKYKDPAAPDTTDLPELPEGWVWCGLEQVSISDKHALKAGPFGSALKKEVYVEAGYKIYGQEQVISGDPTFGDYYIDETKYRELESCAVRPGDLLISLVGTAGKVLVLPPTAMPGIINPRLLKLSLNQTHIAPAYAAYLLQSAWARHYFKLQAHGGTMEILNLGIIKALPVPLPPLDEQRRTVEEVDRRLSLLREVEAQVEINLKRAERLRQAILTQAFTSGLLSRCLEAIT
jgi:type I restriction enzyme, S subunit